MKKLATGIFIFTMRCRFRLSSPPMLIVFERDDVMDGVMIVNKGSFS